MIHGLFVVWPRAHMAGLKNAQAALFSAEMLRAAAGFSFLMADALDKASLSLLSSTSFQLQKTISMHGNAHKLAW